MTKNMNFYKTNTRSETNKINKSVLMGICPTLQNIILTVPHTKVYVPPRSFDKYQQAKYEGTLFLLERYMEPSYMIIVLNQLGLDNYMENISLGMEFQTKKKSVTYVSKDGNKKMIKFESVVNCIEFSEQILEIKTFLQSKIQESESQQLKKQQQIRGLRSQILSSQFFFKNETDRLSNSNTVNLNGFVTTQMKNKNKNKKKKKKKPKQIPLFNFSSNPNESLQLNVSQTKNKIHGNNSNYHTNHFYQKNNSINLNKITNQKETKNYNLINVGLDEERVYGVDTMTTSGPSKKRPKILEINKLFQNCKIEKSKNKEPKFLDTKYNRNKKEIGLIKKNHIPPNERTKNNNKKRIDLLKIGNMITNNEGIRQKQKQNQNQNQNRLVLTKKKLKKALIKLANNDKFLDLLLEAIQEK
ncbi:decapping protein [Anaeramoeba flamelloides]|uniref:Decapping protein n=1 Tax=Anaeramoeba flamelloides TaxID=1746091 RepID=A0ABQ8ZDT3_9EUKA|nr:decapping protein [Anaeramoeba flamelloides]